MTPIQRLEAERDQIIANGGTPGPELFNKIEMLIRLELTSEHKSDDAKNDAIAGHWDHKLGLGR
jgi:hypothetical protein